MALLLVANELESLQGAGTVVQVCFAQPLLPVLLCQRRSGFYRVDRSDCFPALDAARLSARGGHLPADPDSLARTHALQARRQMVVPFGLVLVAFLTLYLFRLIPPVPLSIPLLASIMPLRGPRTEYRLSHERPSWRFWHNGDQDFRAQPGDKVYVFFRIFSPTRFSDQVTMRWYWKDDRSRLVAAGLHSHQHRRRARTGFSRLRGEIQLSARGLESAG